ncbi:MAG: hypothetical protein WCE64_03115 [Bacteroidales bacterium]
MGSDKDAKVVFTAESSDMWGELDMVWKYLYPGISDDRLPVDEQSAAVLWQRLASLALAVPAKSDNEAMISKISGKTIGLNENQMQIRTMSLQFRDKLCLLNITTDTTSYDLSYASGAWQPGETTMHGPNLFTRAKGNLDGLPPFKIAGAYKWNDDQSLELTLRFIDCMHTRQFTFHFEDNNKVLVDINDGRFSRNNAPAIEGVMQ